MDNSLKALQRTGVDELSSTSEAPNRQRCYQVPSYSAWRPALHFSAFLRGLFSLTRYFTFIRFFPNELPFYIANKMLVEEGDQGEKQMKWRIKDEECSL